MSKKSNPSQKRTKFKVVELDSKDAPVENINWQGEELEAKSKTTIDEDKGEGQPIKIFAYDFIANPQTFKEHIPSGQFLFNTHVKQIEIDMWEKGWKFYTMVEPRVILSKNKQYYRIIVAGESHKGVLLKEQPKRLVEVV